MENKSRHNMSSRKNNVLVCLSPSVSHLIPIIQFINKYRFSTNYAFYGSESTKDIVESYGFTYYLSKIDEVRELLAYRKKMMLRKTSEVYKMLHEDVMGIMELGNFDVIMCDISRYTFYGPIGHMLNKEVIIFWTYNGPTHFNIYAPPQSVDFKRTKMKYINILKCLWSWAIHFYNKEIKSKKVLFYFTYPYTTIFSIKNLFKLRYSMDGWFIDTNKIVCGPVEFNRFYDNRTTHTDIVIDTARKVGSSWENKFQGKPLIYLTFGTMNSRYNGIEQTYKLILKSMMNLLNIIDINIVVNLGELDIGLFSEYMQFNKIEFIKEVDQLLILKEANCVIFHGGFGTLKEAYYYRIPMIAIPQTYDQFSNANLISELKLGVKIIQIKNTDIEEVVMQQLTGPNRIVRITT